MNLLLRTELCKRLRAIIFICGAIFLLLYNICDIILTDFGFEVGWSFFLFQKTSIILIFVAINSSLNISQDICGKTVNNKIILGYNIRDIYNTQIIVGIVEALSLFVIDTASIIIFSLIKNFSPDVRISTLIINLIIVIISITVISIFITMLAVVIPNRILSLFIIVGISLVLFQKGDDLSINLIQPAQTIFYNESEDIAPIDNPLYVKGGKRDLYNLELLVSPYAQVQYEKFLLFEEKEQKISSSLILKHIPYHLEFIFVGISEMLILYNIGWNTLKNKKL